VPVVSDSSSTQTPIDHFVLARLEDEGLRFSAEADKLTLLRRACFDLLGRPPTPEQQQRFLGDKRPDAYERLIDRLLASPMYGERWGRHWLDVAGFADSDGYTAADPPRPWAYKYRDYVIRSFNSDKPLDQFIQEQLADDEMIQPPYDNLSVDAIEKLTATGFLRMAPDGTASGDVDQALARNQVMADTLNIVSTALLGLTVGCAQCHDHRYDPIPQKDYYRLRAIFEPAFDCEEWRKPAQRLITLYTDEDRAEAARIEAEAKEIDARRTAKQTEYITRTFEAELEKIDPELREAIRFARSLPSEQRTPAQEKLLRDHPSTNVTAGSLYLYDREAADELKKLAEQAATIRASKPPEEFLRCLTEVPGRIPATHVLIRGDHEQPGDLVQPAGLTILAGANSPAIVEDDPELSTSGRRLAYADYLTSEDHPLTARVLVNRVWMHHFGRGIVGTPGDFGTLGARPTHPELLDWLASELVEGGWRLKRLHRLIMTSTVYRQQSQRRAELDAVAPDNRLLARMPLRRLEAEAIRDAMLMVCGKHEPQMFGKPVPVRVDDVGQTVVGVDTTDSAGRPTGKVVPLHGQEFRPSVYVTVRRSQPLGVLETFDAPVMEPNCERRTASTVAPQALLLMNSQFIRTMATHFARRLRDEVGEDTAQQVAYAWQIAFGGEVGETRQNEAVRFIDRVAAHLVDARLAAAERAAAKDQEAAESAEAIDEASMERAARFEALVGYCQALLSSNRFLYVD